MVVDSSKIVPGGKLSEGALTVSEQLPGQFVSKDQTEVLTREGYWASYNVPFFKEIFTIADYPSRGVESSYDLSPRAKIFRRDAAKVTDMESMKAIMRYNDFRHDKYSEGSPSNTICSRYDLDPNKPSPDGCIDVKVSDLKMARERRSYAVNGPTPGAGLGNFHWKEKFSGIFHWGMPEVYNFSFVEMKPKLS